MDVIPSLLKSLARDYHDLSPQSISYLTNPPTPLEMSRIVALGRPVVIDGFSPIRNQEVTEKEWDDPKTLISLLGEQLVSIAVTPNGKADSIQCHAHSSVSYFVQPLTEEMKMSEFVGRLNDEEEICYLQSQNGNIYRYSGTHEDEEDPQPELATLQRIFHPHVSFMNEALGRDPDAVNLWVGNSKSVTSLHKDPYLNIYTLLSGSKTFTVLPPLEGYLLDLDFYPTATYTRPAEALTITPDDPPSRIPWTRTCPTSLPPDSPLKPITITVEQGQSLYLPAGWWHYVEQSEGSGGICVAVNYWYDQTIDAEKYAMDRLVWRVLGRGDIVDDASDDEEMSV